MIKQHQFSIVIIVIVLGLAAAALAVDSSNHMPANGNSLKSMLESFVNEFNNANTNEQDDEADGGENPLFIANNEDMDQQGFDSKFDSFLKDKIAVTQLKEVAPAAFKRDSKAKKVNTTAWQI